MGPRVRTENGLAEFNDATTVERLSILEEGIFTLERKVAGAAKSKYSPASHRWMDSSNADDLLTVYLAETNEPAAERILHTLISEIAAPYVLTVVL